MRRLWNHFKYADEMMRIFPSLAQVWLVEFFIILPLAFFIGKLIDKRGAWGIPGTREPFDGGLWILLGVGLLASFFFLKNLLFPKFRNDTYTPISTSGPIAGDVGILVVNRRASVDYPFFTSHPAYALLLTTTVWIPIVMVWMCQDRGGNLLYYVASGVAGIAIVVAMALLRFIAYYILRRGPGIVRDWAASRGAGSAARVGWEMAWRPTLLLVGMLYAFSLLPIGCLWRNEMKTIAALPLATAALAESAPDPWIFGSEDNRTWVRVEGTIVGEPVYWPTVGENRGGDNYRGMGVRIALDSGGEALVLAESQSVPDLIGHIRQSKTSGRIRTHGYLSKAIGDNQARYYGFTLDDFPEGPKGGRVIVIHGYP